MTTPDLLQLAQQLNQRGEPFAMVTVVRATPPTSAFVGAQAIVLGDGTLHGWIGGGCARSVVLTAAREALAAGTPRLVRISNETPGAAEPGVELHSMPCASNGEVELFIHPQKPAPLMLVLGATPAADAARSFAEQGGFRVTGDPAWAAPDVVLVMTQGDGDEAALEISLTGRAARVFMVASARKAETLRQAMRMRGITDERLAALEAPAGPDIGASTPQEIALAAVAGAIAWRRNAVPGAQGIDDAPSASTAAVVAGDARATGGRYLNPVCGVAVDPSSARHVIDYGGARFYFCCDGCKVEFERDPARYAAIQANLQPAAAVQGTSA